MAVGHLTYLELTIEQRHQAAERVRDQVRTAFANPFLAADQRMLLGSQLERIDQWENGTLEVGAVFVLPDTKS